MSTELYDIEINSIPPDQINCFIRSILGVSADKVRYSHFWSAEKGDFEYSDNIDLRSYLSEGNSFTLRADTVMLENEYKEAVIIASHVSEGIWLTISIAENDFDEANLPCVTEWLKKMRDKGLISSAVINYEGAAGSLVFI